MPKIKEFHVIFCNTVVLVKSPQTNTKFTHCLLKMVHICRKIKSFFLYACDNLLLVLLKLGTFYAHYTNMTRIKKLFVDAT